MEKQRFSRREVLRIDAAFVAFLAFAHSKTAFAKENPTTIRCPGFDETVLSNAPLLEDIESFRSRVKKDFNLNIVSLLNDYNVAYSRALPKCLDPKQPIGLDFRNVKRFIFFSKNNNANALDLMRIEVFGGRIESDAWEMTIDENGELTDKPVQMDQNQMIASAVRLFKEPVFWRTRNGILAPTSNGSLIGAVDSPDATRNFFLSPQGKIRISSIYRP